MPRRPPIVALLTDFGLTDHYVGVVKSVVLDVLPTVRFIDISHGITPGNIREGAYALWAAVHSLPSGVVVMAVVDPGVGSDRRILMVQAMGHVWVAPDNGLLDMIRGEDARATAFIPSPSTLRRLCGGEISATFHARDIFAPLVAAIAGGSRPAKLGKRATLSPAPTWKAAGHDPSRPAMILTLDRFGNIVTNIVIPPGREPRDVVRMVGVGNIMVSHSIRSYQDGAENTPSMIRGSSGLLEVVVRNGNASALLRAHDRTPLRVMWV